MHTCVECGATAATAGGLALHEATDHNEAVRPSPTGWQAAEFPQTAARRRPAAGGPAPSVATGLVTIVVVLAVVAALILAGRMVLKASSTDASSPSGAAAAPSSAAAMTTARQQYLAAATAFNAEMAPLTRTRPLSEPPVDPRTFFSGYSAALKKFDRSVRAISFPGSVQSHVDVLLSDDGTIESGFDRVVAASNCSCDVLAKLAPLRNKRIADAQQVRADLGLPPLSTED